jgi:very-short-patch-repair endonuclease
MWEQIRGRRFLGLKFRRQFPIDGFVSDFCCYELRLVVELDGRVHEDPSQAERDQNRDAHIRSLGYTVLRFPNEAVLEDMQTVLHEIAEAARLTHLLETRS